jgi:hypothetical protein
MQANVFWIHHRDTEYTEIAVFSVPLCVPARRSFPACTRGLGV